MNVMTYKGYEALVQYDEDAEIFHGEVLALRDVITFQGASVSELKQAFAELGRRLPRLLQGARGRAREALFRPVRRARRSDGAQSACGCCKAIGNEPQSLGFNSVGACRGAQIGRSPIPRRQLSCKFCNGRAQSFEKLELKAAKPSTEDITDTISTRYSKGEIDPSVSAIDPEKDASLSDFLDQREEMREHTRRSQRAGCRTNFLQSAQLPPHNHAGTTGALSFRRAFITCASSFK